MTRGLVKVVDVRHRVVVTLFSDRRALPAHGAFDPAVCKARGRASGRSVGGGAGKRRFPGGGDPRLQRALDAEGLLRAYGGKSPDPSGVSGGAQGEHGLHRGVSSSTIGVLVELVGASDQLPEMQVQKVLPANPAPVDDGGDFVVASGDLPPKNRDAGGTCLRVGGAASGLRPAKARHSGPRSDAGEGGPFLVCLVEPRRDGTLDASSINRVGVAIGARAGVGQRAGR